MRDIDRRLDISVLEVLPNLYWGVAATLNHQVTGKLSGDASLRDLHTTRERSWSTEWNTAYNGLNRAERIFVQTAIGKSIRNGLSTADDIRSKTRDEIAAIRRMGKIRAEFLKRAFEPLKPQK